MHDIQKQNQHAFIQGDVNRLRQGISLKLTHPPVAKTQQNKSKTEITHTAKSSSGQAKYRLQQAEMSIVAENSQNSTHGSAKKSTQQSQNNTELAVKVMTKREKKRYITKECNQTKSNFTFKRPTYSAFECSFGRVTTAVTSTATNSQTKTLS